MTVLNFKLADMDKDEVLKLALHDPSQVFAQPVDVLEDEQLTHNQKIDILKRWAYDEREKSVAEEENMPDLTKTDVNILDEILRCLIILGVTHDENPPTKQG